MNIIIINKSILAQNMFRLLFTGSQNKLTMLTRLEDALRTEKKSSAVDLILIDSNVLGTKFEDSIEKIANHEPWLNIKKIFICSETRRDKLLQDAVKKLGNSKIITKPFEPMEFLKSVSLSPTKVPRRSSLEKTTKTAVVGPERRIFPRKKGTLRVTFLDEFADGLFYVISGDISLSGIYLDSDVPLQTGTLLRMAFAIPPHKREVVVTGQVVRQHAQGGRSGSGVKFVGLANDALLGLTDYLGSKRHANI